MGHAGDLKRGLAGAGRAIDDQQIVGISDGKRLACGFEGLNGYSRLDGAV